MATVTQRLESLLDRDAPAWGIEPVPPEHRRLSGLDFGVLWGDLALGLLVVLIGALLVPALGFPTALGAIVVGSVIGCVPLALVGLAGAREGVPGMVLFRPVLGTRGSYLPSVLNIVQLVGWTGFEFWAMALVADRMSDRVFGVSSYWVWLAVVAIVCTGLALGGPIIVIRQWLEKFGVWVVAAVAAWVTFRAITTADLGEIWRRPGTGGFPGSFWLAVDLVIAMPVSWLPLVADYTRFGRRGAGSAVGTYVGYAVGNVWFYALGALLVLSAALSEPTPAGLGQAIASLAGGWIVLLALLVGETDEAFADVYSAAVSSQNLQPRIPQRAAVAVVGVLGVALAAWLGDRADLAIGTYESFLLLLGSAFVPLFGVFTAHYFVLRRSAAGAVDRAWPIEWRALAAWVVGFAVYQWSAPTPLEGWSNVVQTVVQDWLGLPFPLWDSVAGASIPSFAAALGLFLVLALVRRRGWTRAKIS